MKNIVIKRLTPELSDDYFDFFENRAFTDKLPLSLLLSDVSNDKGTGENGIRPCRWS